MKIISCLMPLTQWKLGYSNYPRPVLAFGYCPCLRLSVCVSVCVKDLGKNPYCFYASAFRRQRHYVFGLSVRPSVRPSIRPKPEIPSFDLYMGPLVHPTNRNRFTACPSVRLSVCPSGEVSGHLLENAWRDWPEILYADVSWPSSVLISLWLWSVDFSNFGTILT